MTQATTNIEFPEVEQAIEEWLVNYWDVHIKSQEVSQEEEDEDLDYEEEYPEEEGSSEEEIQAQQQVDQIAELDARIATIDTSIDEALPF